MHNLLSILPVTRSDERAMAAILASCERARIVNNRVVIIDKSQDGWVEDFIYKNGLKNDSIEVIIKSNEGLIKSLTDVKTFENEWVQLLADDDFWFGKPIIESEDVNTFYFAEIIGYLSSGSVDFESLDKKVNIPRSYSGNYFGDRAWHGIISPKFWKLFNNWVKKCPYMFPHISLQLSWLALALGKNIKINNFIFIKDARGWIEGDYSSNIENYYRQIGMDSSFAKFDSVFALINRSIFLLEVTKCRLDPILIEFFNWDVYKYNSIYRNRYRFRTSNYYWRARRLIILKHKRLYRLLNLSKNNHSMQLMFIKNLQELCITLDSNFKLPKNLYEFWINELELLKNESESVKNI